MNIPAAMVNMYILTSPVADIASPMKRPMKQQQAEKTLSSKARFQLIPVDKRAAMSPADRERDNLQSVLLLHLSPPIRMLCLYHVTTLYVHVSHSVYIGPGCPVGLQAHDKSS